MTATALATHRKSVAEVLHELGDISPHRMPMGTATFVKTQPRNGKKM